ncbi:hypothetical protein [Azonexus sp.]|jgi:hypothetical protein|uniref:hypothetical protein n=1 Tax=Azonexus sp. TaxID=1872668 RepID=UPI002838F98B|nr:hypothetical protein [Azonexus sp.]MDR1995143.1 hypothetical protein [Azonexus sp.]
MLSDLKKLVDGLVRDEVDRLSRADRTAAIGLAVARYGSDRPRQKVEDVVCGGGDSLPLPAAWEPESTLVSAEYPIGSMPPALLPCTIYTLPAGDVLRLGKALDAGAELRLTFTVGHVVSDLLDTIRPAHREGVAAYAAALLLEELAAAAINDGDSTISADSTDRRTKAQEYASRARALKSRYSEVLTLGKEGGPGAVGTAVTWPSRKRLTDGISRRG